MPLIDVHARPDKKYEAQAKWSARNSEWSEAQDSKTGGWQARRANESDFI